MTKEKQEHLILQIKYAFLALIIGICVGIVDTVFGRGLLAISAFRTAYYQFLLPFLPLTGLLIIWLYQHFSSLSLKGMSLIFETGQKKREEIPLALVPLVIICTWITHLFGGSAGREGVAVQIGATISHEAGRRLHIKEKTPVMLITGMAAGFGGLFQTPLAAVFFAMEVIVAGYMEYDALLPALIAAYAASTTSHMLGLEKFAVNITENWNISGSRDVLILIILGVVFGLTGRFFSAGIIIEIPGIQGKNTNSKTFFQIVCVNPTHKKGIITYDFSRTEFVDLINQFLAIWYFCKETVTCGNIRYCTTKAVCYGDN